MQHICPRCHFTTKYKSHFISHLERKQQCSPIYENVMNNEILETVMTQHIKERLYMCNKCDACFVHASSLSRHRNISHKNLNEQPVTNINSNNYTNTVNSNNTTNNTTNNNTTNNTTNNNTTINNSAPIQNTNNTTNNINITINITPFGEHSIKHVEDQIELLTRSLKNILGDGIPNLIETIHLNPEIPENHNVKLHRIKHPSTMKVYTRTQDGECQWIEKDMNATLEKVIQGGVDILASHHNNQTDSVDSEIFDMRNDKIIKLRKKQRGVYGNVRNGVLCKFKEDKNK